MCTVRYGTEGIGCGVVGGVGFKVKGRGGGVFFFSKIRRKEGWEANCFSLFFIFLFFFFRLVRGGPKGGVR